MVAGQYLVLPLIGGGPSHAQCIGVYMVSLTRGVGSSTWSMGRAGRSTAVCWIAIHRERGTLAVFCVLVNITWAGQFSSVGGKDTKTYMVIIYLI